MSRSGVAPKTGRMSRCRKEAQRLQVFSFLGLPQ